MDIRLIAVFKITFLSILFEALPFILLGSFISSLINEFITEEHISNFIPKNKILAVIGASFAGLLFPVCECAIIPIMRRLLQKGMPIYVAIPFMVSVPIINPVVLFSTFIAFRGIMNIVILRAGMGIIVAWLLGGVLSIYHVKSKDLLLDNMTISSCGCGHDHGHIHHENCGCAHSHSHNHHHNETANITIDMIFDAECEPEPRFPWSSIFIHTGSEFLAVGRLLIFGAFLSAIFKTFVPYAVIVQMSSHKVLSILTMMLVAFILSLCSEADAFIARTFVGIFPTSAIMSFLVLGPMIDVKNYIMLRGTFKKKFVFLLTTMIFCIVFIISILSSFIV